jgi:hypothetical protein
MQLRIRCVIQSVRSVTPIDDVYPIEEQIVNALMEVPTVLVYPKNSTIPSSWGFLSEKPTEQMSEDKECKEWFKTFLDEDKLRQAQGSLQSQGVCPASIQEVEQL